MFLFEEITTYIAFGADDSARLRDLYPRAAPHFPQAVDAFYEALHDQEATRLIFSSPEQILRLHNQLALWLEDLFLGPHDHAYFERRRRIGLAHVRVGLRPQYMFGAMNIIRRQLLAAVFKDDPRGCGSDDAGSLEKILDIDLTIMLQTYWEELMRSKLQVPAALASGLAHEIRNPLNAIGLHLTLLERRLRRLGDESEAVNASLEVIRGELSRMRALTSEIVDFAKPLDLACAWIDPQELLDAIQNTHAASLRASGIDLTLHTSGTSRFWGDRDQLQLALVNLLRNAVEAIDGPGEIKLDIRCEPTFALIKLEDSGAGIPRDHLGQVFDLFFTTKASGTGLGLPAVQKIAEAHQGHVEVDSVPGRTTIWLRLPTPG